MRPDRFRLRDCSLHFNRRAGTIEARRGDRVVLVLSRVEWSDFDAAPIQITAARKVRCEHCGDIGHEERECRLKRQGERELAEEAKRRERKAYVEANKGIPVRGSSPSAKP